MINFFHKIVIWGYVQCSECGAEKHFTIVANELMPDGVDSSDIHRAVRDLATESPVYYGWKWLQDDGINRADLPVYCPQCIPKVEAELREEWHFDTSDCPWCDSGKCRCPSDPPPAEEQRGTEDDPWIFEVGFVTGLHPPR